MTPPLGRRLARLEKSLAPITGGRYLTMSGPAEGSSPEQCRQFESDVRVAALGADGVWVIAAKPPPTPTDLPNVHHVSAEWEAHLEILSLLPSECGHANRLDDVAEHEVTVWSLNEWFSIHLSAVSNW